MSSVILGHIYITNTCSNSAYCRYSEKDRVIWDEKRFYRKSLLEKFLKGLSGFELAERGRDTRRLERAR